MYKFYHIYGFFGNNFFEIISNRVEISVEL